MEPMTPPLLALLAVVSLQQAPQASLVGSIRDAVSGRSVVGATVLLADVGRATISGAEGVYELVGVPAGPQHVTVSSFGHATRTVHALMPSTGYLVIDIALEPAPIPLEAVTVEPVRPVGGVQLPEGAAAAERSLSLAAIRNHPLLAEPDVFQAFSGGEVVIDPEAPSGIHIRGGASDHTAYLLDGIPILDPVHAGGLFSAWNPDALSNISLNSTSPSPLYTDALSGVVSAETRASGGSFGSESHLSTSHVGLTVHGGLFQEAAGYLVSLRSGLTDALAPHNEASYLRGGTRDAIAKVGVEVVGGELGVLFYGADNSLTGASRVDSTSGAAGPSNLFAWGARSIGATWERASTERAISLKAWRATSNAGSTWGAALPPVVLKARREDLGIQASLRSTSPTSTREVGIRALRMRTEYEVASRMRASLVTASVFGEGTWSLGSGVHARLGTSLTSSFDDVYLAPRAQLTWRASTAWTVSLSGTRLHQFTQSLRNPESVTGHVFPAELGMAAVGGVPVPRSDQFALAGDWQPVSALHLGVQGYVRGIEGLALVAPVALEPFSWGSFALGRMTARGLSLDASWSGARLSWVARYGAQRVRVHSRGATYQPAHGATHILDAGLVLHASSSTSVRFGFGGAWGRRGTDVGGDLEWEACNLVDLGCEFAGSPVLGSAPGTRKLPPYARVDVGGRKHWHVRMAGREALIGVFGTLTNVFGRTNVLT